MQQMAYILAASHSGSTLLAMLLGSHPDVCTVGELKVTSLGDTDRYRCSCGALIKQCRFWREISDALGRRGIPFTIDDAGTDYRSCSSAYARRLLKPLHRGPLLERIRDVALGLSPTWRAEHARVQQRNAALAHAVCETAKAKIIVDSSKIALRLKYLWRNPDLNVKVIRLIRDGRAVALTYTDPARYADAQEAALRGGGMGGDRRGERLTISQAAYEWRRSNEEAECVLAGVDSSRWMQVRYEDLCADPGKVLDGVFEFLGVDPKRAVRDFRSVEQHVIGNGMRLDRTSEIRLDERWRTALTDQDLRVFATVAGEMNRRYGYT